MAAIFYDFFLNGNGKKSRQNHKFRERKKWNEIKWKFLSSKLSEPVFY